jgi:hypothetical protein
VYRPIGDEVAVAIDFIDTTQGQICQNGLSLYKLTTKLNKFRN